MHRTHPNQWHHNAPFWYQETWSYGQYTVRACLDVKVFTFFIKWLISRYEHLNIRTHKYENTFTSLRWYSEITLLSFMTFHTLTPEVFETRCWVPKILLFSDQRSTRPEPLPPANFSTSSALTRLKSPGMVCFRQDAATANSKASFAFFLLRRAKMSAPAKASPPPTRSIIWMS